MSAGADIELATDGFVLGQILDGNGDYAIELTQFVPTGNRPIQYFWVEADDPAGIERALRADGRVADLTVHEVHAGQSLFEIEWAGPLDGFLATLLELDIVLLKGNGTPEGWEFEFFVDDPDQLTRFHERCRREGIPIRIKTVYDDGPAAPDRVAFTDRQREILDLALREGYFSIPREITISEISEELDISPQAASKLLRRGLDTAVSFALDGPR